MGYNKYRIYKGLNTSDHYERHPQNVLNNHGNGCYGDLRAGVKDICVLLSYSPACTCLIQLHTYLSYLLSYGDLQASVIDICMQISWTTACMCNRHLRACVIDSCMQMWGSQICPH